MNKISRRKFMSYSLAASGLYLLDPTQLIKAQVGECARGVLGPFYRAGAPERNVLGEENNLVGYGYVTSMDEEPVPGALLEIWHATPGKDARYIGFTSPDYEYYASLYTDKEGYYEFYTDMPGIYQARPIRHIHYRFSAKGYQPLVTQYCFSDAGKETEAPLDVVLIPQG